MTWSILARDGTGRIGVAVATRAFAVGARVPFAETGVGLLATQAFVNPFYGPQGLALLRAGLGARAVVEHLTFGDEGRDERQLHVMDLSGGVAAHTGAANVPWCGHLTGEDCSVAGNMLAGPGVIEATAATFAATRGQPLADRLLAAMAAGEAAGGDKRGRQSAALLIHDAEAYAEYDLRVDDAPDPLAELARLAAVSRERNLHYRRMMPSRANPFGVRGREEIERRIAASLDAGYDG